MAVAVAMGASVGCSKDGMGKQMFSPWGEHRVELGPPLQIHVGPEPGSVILVWKQGLW